MASAARDLPETGMAALLFVSKRLQPIAIALLLLAMVQLTFAAREPHRPVPAQPGTVIVAVSSGSQ